MKIEKIIEDGIAKAIITPDPIEPKAKDKKELLIHKQNVDAEISQCQLQLIEVQRRIDALELESNTLADAINQL